MTPSQKLISATIIDVLPNDPQEALRVLAWTCANVILSIHEASSEGFANAVEQEIRNFNAKGLGRGMV